MKKETYIVSVQENDYTNYIGIIHDLSETTLERVREVIEKDNKWNLKVFNESFALPCGMLMTTNCSNINVIISSIEEI